MINFKEKMKEAKKSPYFKAMSAILNVLSDVSRIMKNKKLSKKDLAEKMGVSPAYITKILRGNENLSMETIAKIAVALDCELKAPVIYDPLVEDNHQLYDFSRIQIRVSDISQTLTLEKIENTNEIVLENYKQISKEDNITCWN